MTEQNQPVANNPNENSNQDNQIIPESTSKELLVSNSLSEELTSTGIDETAMALVDLCTYNSSISTISTQEGEISNSHIEIGSDDIITSENAPTKKRKRGPYKKREKDKGQAPSKTLGRPKTKNIPSAIPVRMLKISPKSQQNLPSPPFKIQFPGQLPGKIGIPALKRITKRRHRTSPSSVIPSILPMGKMPLTPLKSTTRIEKIPTHFEMLYLEQSITTKQIDTCIQLGFMDKFSIGPKAYDEHPKISQNRFLDLIIKPMYPMMIRMKFVYDISNESPILFLSSSNPRLNSNQTTLVFCSSPSKNPPLVPYVLLERVHREHITLNLPKEQITSKRRKITIIHLQIEIFTLDGKLIGIVKSEPFHVRLKIQQNLNQLVEKTTQVSEQIK